MIDSKKLVDSNIFIYAFDTFENEKHVIAEKILEKIFKNELVVNLSTQNLSEFYFITTRKIKKPLSSEEAREIISDLMSIQNVTISIIKPTTITLAIDISSKFSIHYWDALIASVMYENNVNIIITENEKDFGKIPWLEVVNPFK